VPTYCYECQNCSAILEFRHSYKELKTDCTECEKPMLVKTLNTPVKILSKKTDPQAKAGSVVNATIEDIKDEVKQERDKLKKRERK
jgi:putative FmdB family regulatory protein